MQAALTYAQEHQTDILSNLEALLRIPSISTFTEHNATMQQAAQWLANKLIDVGLENVSILPTAGHPVVYADWLHAGPNAPTLLVYGHYDVQPVDPVEEWLTPPFEPTIKGDNLYCRGATDDKGQLYTHVAAVEAYLKSGGQMPLNIKFMLEGEEEIGSLNLEDFMGEHKDLLKADAAVLSDTHMQDPQTPILVAGVRGLIYTEIHLRGSRQDLHSGAYGGVVENPLNAMAKLLAALHDNNGRVAIPGFYDQVAEVPPDVRDILRNGPVTDETILAETGAPALWGEPEYSVAERIGVRPTLDVHGIKGGFIDPGQKTVIPATATAKVSMRLVPNQNPAEIVRLYTEHIYRLAPPTMEVKVDILTKADSAVVEFDSPAIQAAVKAYEQGFGHTPVFLREGGSLPVVGMFQRILGAPAVLMGFGLPDDNLHAPNEKIYLPNFYRGIETAIYYYNIFGGKK
jgi:acetylornithine deacetylase/succinyl-diaminopimelate desuccinylase-like protein